jgi:hypothetical protein
LHKLWNNRRAWRTLALAAAALPIFQIPGCIPDPIGALNFQIQSLIDVTLIDAFNTIVQNFLGLWTYATFQAERGPSDRTDRRPAGGQGIRQANSLRD